MSSWIIVTVLAWFHLDRIILSYDSINLVVVLSYRIRCHEPSQQRYESLIGCATTCTIGSSKYKNLKLKKKRWENSSGVYGRHYISPTGHMLSLRSVTRETVTQETRTGQDRIGPSRNIRTSVGPYLIRAPRPYIRKSQPFYHHTLWPQQ